MNNVLFLFHKKSFLSVHKPNPRLESCCECSISLIVPITVVMNGHFLAGWYEEILTLDVTPCPYRQISICALSIFLKGHLARVYSPQFIKI